MCIYTHMCKLLNSHKHYHALYLPKQKQSKKKKITAATKFN